MQAPLSIDTDSCSTVSSSYGSHNPEKYYENPELIGPDALAEVATQKEDPQSYYSTIYNSRAWDKRNLEDSYVNCMIERTGLVVQKENLCSQPKPNGWLSGHEETKIYRVQYFYNWEVNDCNCYRTPGIAPELCLSPPSATTTTSPPSGSEWL